MQRLLDALCNIYTTTYPPSGYSVVSGKLNKSLVLKGSDDEDYLHHPITMLTTFFGLPNRKLKRRQPPSWLNIFYNLIGWQRDTSLGKKIVNVFALPIVLFWHLLTMLPRFAVNILKLVTEFLPALAKIGFDAAANQFDKKANTSSSQLRILFLAGFYAAKSGYYFSHLLYFIGRATTSPLNGARCALRDGRQFGEALASPGSRSSKVLGWVFAILLSSLSSATTTIVYALTFPITLKFIVATAAPPIISILPKTVVAALAPAVKFLLQVITAPHHKIMHALNPVYCTLGLPMTEAILRNIGIRAGQIIALGIDTARRHWNHWWRAPKQNRVTDNKTQSLLPSSSSRIHRVVGMSQNKNQLPRSYSFNDLKKNTPSPSGKGMRLFESKTMFPRRNQADELYQGIKKSY